MVPNHSVRATEFIGARPTAGLGEVLAEAPHNLCAEITANHKQSRIVSMFPA